VLKVNSAINYYSEGTINYVDGAFKLQSTNQPVNALNLLYIKLSLSVLK